MHVILEKFPLAVRQQAAEWMLMQRDYDPNDVQDPLTVCIRAAGLPVFTPAYGATPGEVVAELIACGMAEPAEVRRLTTSAGRLLADWEKGVEFELDRLFGLPRLGRRRSKAEMANIQRISSVV